MEGPGRGRDQRQRGDPGRQRHLPPEPLSPPLSRSVNPLEFLHHRDLYLVLWGGAAVANVDFPGRMLAEVVKDHLHELRFEPLLPLLRPHLTVLIAVIIVRKDGFQGETQVECLFFLKHSGLTVMIEKRSASATVVSKDL